MAEEAQPDDGAGEGEGAPEPAAAAPGNGEADRALNEVPVEISAVLGTARVPVAQLLKMGRGAVLELDRKVGDPIEIFVNKRMVARGEVTVLDDRLGVTLSETIKLAR